MSPEGIPVYDVLGIGFGPSNVALAAALQERESPLSAHFLESHDGPCWQPGMLLDGADCQHYPSRDLATPRNPRSRYTFLNYLAEQDRLYAYTNLGVEFPLRKEYADYVRWVARFFDDQVSYGAAAVHVDCGVDPESGRPVWLVTTRAGETRGGRALVVGTGRTPNVPAVFTRCGADRVLHSCDYLPRIAELSQRPGFDRVAVIGASQSSIEIVLDLRRRWPALQVVNVMRSFGYRLKDTSQFSEEVFHPAFTETYFAASEDVRGALWSELRQTNYASADGDVIRELYLAMYEEQLDGAVRTEVLSHQAVTHAVRSGDRIELQLDGLYDGSARTLEADVVILGTGYRTIGPAPGEERCPPLLVASRHRFATDSEGAVCVGHDYALAPASDEEDPAPVFLSGLCESSHGFGDAGSFGQVALRAERMAISMEERLAADRVLRGSAS